MFCFIFTPSIHSPYTTVGVRATNKSVRERFTVQHSRTNWLETNRSIFLNFIHLLFRQQSWERKKNKNQTHEWPDTSDEGSNSTHFNLVFDIDRNRILQQFNFETRTEDAIKYSLSAAQCQCTLSIYIFDAHEKQTLIVASPSSNFTDKSYS